MKVQIHHCDGVGQGPRHVANVRFEGEDIERALDYAWRRSNNIEGSWSRGMFLSDGSHNPDYSLDVELLVGLPHHKGRVYGLRSSMVGDVFVIESASRREAYRVGRFGFEPCELPE